MANRKRHSERRRIRIALGRQDTFVNPYPWMSEPEAMVHLELERRRVPFSWRFFDGDNSPHRDMMGQDFHPEFTLREYRICIVVIGGFFGTLPSILDRTALGVALLEMDGWKVAVFNEAEIRSGVSDLIDKELPELKVPSIQGPPREHPFSVAPFMERRRRQLSGLALLARSFAFDRQEQDAARSRIRRPRRGVSRRDGGRRRISRA